MTIKTAGIVSLCQKIEVMGLEDASAQMGPVAIVTMGLVGMALAVLMMWLAAVIVNIKDATLGRAFVTVMVLSIITVATGAMLGKLSQIGIAVAAGIAIIVSLLAIKLIYRTGFLKALGVLVLNIMMQVIISSLYVRAMMGEDFPAGES